METIKKQAYAIGIDQLQRLVKAGPNKLPLGLKARALRNRTLVYKSSVMPADAHALWLMACNVRERAQAVAAAADKAAAREERRKGWRMLMGLNKEHRKGGAVDGLAFQEEQRAEWQ